ncbi:MAG: hypothetical protein ACJ71Q_14475 [Terriglobales bacterium]
MSNSIATLVPNALPGFPNVRPFTTAQGATDGTIIDSPSSWD